MEISFIIITAEINNKKKTIGILYFFRTSILLVIGFFFNTLTGIYVC